jgi:hypothetical protein
MRVGALLRQTGRNGHSHKCEWEPYFAGLAVDSRAPKNARWWTGRYLDSKLERRQAITSQTGATSATTAGEPVAVVDRWRGGMVFGPVEPCSRRANRHPPAARPLHSQDPRWRPESVAPFTAKASVPRRVARSFRDNLIVCKFLGR